MSGQDTVGSLMWANTHIPGVVMQNSIVVPVGNTEAFRLRLCLPNAHNWQIYIDRQ